MTKTPEKPENKENPEKPEKTSQEKYANPCDWIAYFAAAG